MEMSPARRIEPEWLDDLRTDDPRALRSRRDLARINGWMRHLGLMPRLLLKQYRRGQPRTMLEIGAGDGTFMLRVARQLAPYWPDIHLVLLDRQPIVSAQTRAAFASLQWTTETVTADVFQYFAQAGMARFDIITTNLFLHHFQAERLALLFARAAQLTDLFAACEPRRGAGAMAGTRLLWTIGCNDVTRHDALVSARAGFKGKELSMLWPTNAQWTTGEWDLHERAAFPFTQCFVARRKSEGMRRDL
jgi:SAM-dependent methyltransferase